MARTGSARAGRGLEPAPTAADSERRKELLDAGIPALRTADFFFPSQTNESFEVAAAFLTAKLI
jgi:hypothetical protein